MYNLPAPKPKPDPYDYATDPVFVAQLRRAAESGGGVITAPLGVRTAPREHGTDHLHDFWTRVDALLLLDGGVWKLAPPGARDDGASRRLVPA